MIRFVVEGDPVGYTRTTRAGKWNPRVKKYHAYMITVQAIAKMAGLKVPLLATEDAPIIIKTRCTFGSRRHPDPENCQKGAVDALFYTAKGGDKYVGGSYEPPAYGDKPRMEVIVIGDNIARRSK